MSMLYIYLYYIYIYSIKINNWPGIAHHCKYRCIQPGLQAGNPQQASDLVTVLHGKAWPGSLMFVRWRLIAFRCFSSLLDLLGSFLFRIFNSVVQRVILTIPDLSGPSQPSFWCKRCDLWEIEIEFKSFWEFPKHVTCGMLIGRYTWEKMRGVSEKSIEEDLNGKFGKKIQIFIVWLQWHRGDGASGPGLLHSLPRPLWSLQFFSQQFALQVKLPEGRSNQGVGEVTHQKWSKPQQTPERGHGPSRATPRENLCKRTILYIRVCIHVICVCVITSY